MPRGDDASNAWLAAQLRELAARLELRDDPHRPRAYRRAADTLQALSRSAAKIRAEEGPEGLDRLPGIGPQIASLLCELLDTGKSALLERARKQTPVDVMALLAVDGIGPATVKRFWRELGVRNVSDLDRALREERVRTLPGFGARREERLRHALQAHARVRRFPLAEASRIAKRLRAALVKSPAVIRCEIAGSIRRGSEAIGDIDLVAASEDPESVAALLLARPELSYVHSEGPHRVSVQLKEGIDVDLRVVPEESFGAALLYFTGNRAHTVGLRRLALAEGMHLNEYGLFRDDERVAGASEEEIYQALALPYLEPKARQGGAEIREALARRGGTER